MCSRDGNDCDCLFHTHFNYVVVNSHTFMTFLVYYLGEQIVLQNGLSQKSVFIPGKHRPSCMYLSQPLVVSAPL